MKYFHKCNTILKQLYQLEKVKISAIKICLDCEITALNDKTNTLFARTDLALKAIDKKQEKTIHNLKNTHTHTHTYIYIYIYIFKKHLFSTKIANNKE